MGLGRIGVESQERGGVAAKEVLNGFDGAVADAQPNEFGRTAVKKAAELKIGILGNNGKSILPGVIPNGGIVGVAQAELADVRAAREQISQRHGAGSARGFGRRGASCRQRGQLAFAVSGKGQAGANVFLGEIGKLGEEFGVAHTRSQIFQDIGDSHAGPADAGFAAALAGFNGDNLMIIHHLKIIRNPARVKAKGGGAEGGSQKSAVSGQ